MIADLKPYAEYKESGLSWLGPIPAHWQTVRNGSLFGQRSQTGYAELPILEVSLKTGVQVRSFGQAGRKQIMSDLGKYKRAVKGDLAYNTMRMWQGALGVCPVDGLVSPAYVVARPYPGVDARYFAALFRTGDYMAEIDSASRGIVKDRNRLYWDQFKQMQSPCPPPAEQVAITQFLDWANSRLERAIRAKRKVIALLMEQKHAIVRRAITHGLNQCVPLKSTGVRWLGDIPQHWEVRRLKHLAQFQSGDGITSLQIEETGSFPVYGGNGLRGYATRYTHDGDYALIGRQGALCGNINFASGKFFASEHAVVPTLQPGVSLAWFGELLRVMNLNQYSQSAAQPGLAVERIKNLYAPVPPSDEQQRLVESFERSTAPITAGISRLEREIDLLREYRTRLVSDVVTGKLDVRDAAKFLPFETASDTADMPPDDPEDTELADEEAEA